MQEKRKFTISHKLFTKMKSLAKAANKSKGGSKGKGGRGKGNWFNYVGK